MWTRPRRSASSRPRPSGDRDGLRSDPVARLDRRRRRRCSGRRCHRRGPLESTSSTIAGRSAEIHGVDVVDEDAVAATEGVPLETQHHDGRRFDGSRVMSQGPHSQKLSRVGTCCASGNIWRQRQHRRVGLWAGAGGAKVSDMRVTSWSLAGMHRAASATAATTRHGTTDHHELLTSARSRRRACDGRRTVRPSSPSEATRPRGCDPHPTGDSSRAMGIVPPRSDARHGRVARRPVRSRGPDGPSPIEPGRAIRPRVSFV